jgi:hypothetical protein
VTPITLKHALSTAAVPVTVLALAGLTTIWAQERQQGPLTPPPRREVVRIPVDTTPAPPPIPPEEIIRRFVEKEDEFQRARAAYLSKKTIRVQELGDEGPIGEFRFATEPALASDGKWYEKVVEQRTSTLKRLKLAAEDLETLARIPQFPLVGGQINKYELTYAGKQQVDELTTYLFRVKPRQLERARAYFEGLVWVDDRDFLIVKSYGKWVTETGNVSSPQLPFIMFETYREMIEGKYWFPTYARSDDSLRVKDGEVPIRLTIRWTDYKPLPSSPAPKQPQDDKLPLAQSFSTNAAGFIC